MSHTPPCRRRTGGLIAFVAIWQAVIYVLSLGGIFVDIYQLLSIPWTATGLLNVVGTTIGLALLELPALLIVGFWMLRERISEQNSN